MRKGSILISTVHDNGVFSLRHVEKGRDEVGVFMDSHHHHRNYVKVVDGTELSEGV